MEPPWLLYRRVTKPILGRVEIVYAEHYLYNAWHMWILKKWSKWELGGEKIFQEEGAARTVVGRLKQPGML